ncbi:MAG: hypothetical protein ACPGRF_06090, partial [Miltoncostaeaceae bacterium]
MSAPAPGVVERKQAVDRRLYSAEARLRAAIDRQAVLTSDLATINRRLREVRGRLAPLAARRDEAVRAHRLARGTLVQVNRNLAFQRRQLRIATSRLRVQRQALAERIREIYRTEDDDPLLGLLQGGSLAEIAGAASGIERATDRDRDMIDSVARYRNLTRTSAALPHSLLPHCMLPHLLLLSCLLLPCLLPCLLLPSLLLPSLLLPCLLLPCLLLPSLLLPCLL